MTVPESRILEPMAFKFCPAIPAIFLPWKLSENHYFPSHLTLVLFTVLDSCLVSPVVEEALKLIALKTVMGKRASKKSKIVTSADLGPTQFAPKKEHTLKSYVVVMTALSLGLKVADSVRRILLYTHANQKHKMFFALARSFFPGKLCATVTNVSLLSVLSYAALSCPALSYPILSCIILSFSVLSCTVLFCPALSCRAPSYSVLFCLWSMCRSTYSV